MARVLTALLALALPLAGCSAPARPPDELSGLWSAGPAACAAGVGVRFRGDSIQAVYRQQAETLFAQPRYTVERGGSAFRIRIVYALPRLPGGAASAGAHGMLVLARGPEGLTPLRHNLVDARTGAVRLRMRDDPAVALLTLQSCGGHVWGEELRGLSGT